MSGRSQYKQNPESKSWKNGIQLLNTQWNTIREQLEILGRKRAPTETEKFFAPLELAGAANEHFNGRFALGAAGIAFPWAGGLDYFKVEYAKKDPIARPTGFKALACKLNLDSEAANCRSWANDVFVAYTTWLETRLTTGTAPTVPTYGGTKRYDSCLEKCFQFCYFFICYFAEDYNNFNQAYEGCKAKYREVFRIQAKQGGTKSIKRAKDIMEKQASQRWCAKKLTEGSDDLQACPQKHRHFLGQRKFLNDQYVEDLIKLFLSHEPQLDDYHPGPQDVDAARDWLDAILDWREREDTDPILKAETEWLTHHEWDPKDKSHLINPGNQRTLALRAKEELVREEVKRLWTKCRQTKDDAERRAAFEAYLVYGEANLRDERATPKMKPLLRKKMPNYHPGPVPTSFIKAMDELYKAACVAKDSTELSAAYVAYSTQALDEPSYRKRPRPLLKKELLEAVDRQCSLALSAPPGTPAGNKAYIRYRALLKKLDERAFEDLELPEDLPETHQEWYDGLEALGMHKSTPAEPKTADATGTPKKDEGKGTTVVTPDEPLGPSTTETQPTSEDLPETHQEWYDGLEALGMHKSTPAEPKTADATGTPKKDEGKGTTVVTPDEPLGPSTTETQPTSDVTPDEPLGPSTSETGSPMAPTTLGGELDTETQPTSESDDAPAVILDKSKLAHAYTKSALFVSDPVSGKTCANPKETPPGKVRFMEVEKEKKAQKKAGNLPLSSFTEEERKQRIEEIQQGRTRLEAERLASAQKQDPTVTQVPPIVYPPIELFVIYGELHDKAEWDRKSEGWKHSFHHHTASGYDRGNPYPKKHCEGTPFQRSIGYLYPKKHWDEVCERFDLHQTRLPTTDHLKNVEHDYWGSEESADVAQVNLAVFLHLRSVIDLPWTPWAKAPYREDHMHCLEKGPSDDAHDLTTIAVCVGICLGFFRPEWIEEASGDAAEQSLLQWMSRPMRTGFTAYMEAFYLMAISHEPRVKKIIYDRCLMGATADPDDSSLPLKRMYQCSVVQAAARRIYDERETEIEPKALKTPYKEGETEDEPDALKTLQEQGRLNVLRPMKLSRRGQPLKLLKAPSYQTSKKKRKWSDRDFSLEEHQLDELAFKEKTLGRKQAMNDKVRDWLTEDTGMQEMTGWFETGEHGAHSRWDRSRGFFEKPKEAQPVEQDGEA